MKWTIVILVILSLAIGLGLLLKVDPGYVYIEYSNWTVEMPLMAALLGLLILWFVTDLAIKLIVEVWGLPSVFKKWRLTRKTNYALSHTEKGFMDLLIGEYSSAEKHLLKGVQPKLKFSVFNYIALSYISVMQKQPEKQDKYIAQAISQSKKIGHDKHMEFMIELINAKLQLKQDHVEEASALFERLEKVKPNNKLVAIGLKDVALSFGDDKRLLLILKRLKKMHAIDDNDAQNIRITVALLQLKQSAKESEAALISWYDGLDSSIRFKPEILIPMARQAIGQGWDDAIEPWLREAISHDFNGDIVRAYGFVSIANGAKQLKIATRWLDKYPCNIYLLITLGRLCWREKLWGQARAYLNDALKQDKNPEAYYLLGLVEQELEMDGQALSSFHSGLAINQSHL